MTPLYRYAATATRIANLSFNTIAKNGQIKQRRVIFYDSAQRDVYNTPRLYGLPIQPSGIGRRNLIARRSSKVEWKLMRIRHADRRISQSCEINAAIDVERDRGTFRESKNLRSDLRSVRKSGSYRCKYGHDLKRLPPNAEGIFIHEIFEHHMSMDYIHYIASQRKFR